MKKILLVINNFKIGGIEKSLINFIKSNVGKYKIDVFCFSKSGVLFKELPKEINIIEANSLLKPFGISNKDALKKPFMPSSIFRIFYAIWSKIFSNKIPLKIGIKTQRYLKEYDLAIAYSHDSSINSLYYGVSDFVLSKVSSNIKAYYIHGDFEKSGLNNKYQRKKMMNFDYILSVSNSAANQIINKFPEVSEKVKVLPNYMNYNDIILLSKENINFNFFEEGYLNMISVSRLSEEKGYDRSLKIIKELVNKGVKIKWVIIGGGKEYLNIKNYIELNNLNNVILLGEKNNPLPYILKADLFYLGSFHEAAPLVILEALALKIPVLSTNTLSAVEMIGIYGWVVENNEKDIKNMIEKIYNNRVEIKNKKDLLSEYEPSNRLSDLSLGKLIGERYE